MDTENIFTPMHCHLCPSLGEISDNPQRIGALYAPFRPNSDSYDLKMKFWTKVVDEFVTFGNRFTFTLKELQKGLMINNFTPSCLPEVLQHLSMSGKVLPQSEFDDYNKSSTSWMAWSQITAKRTLTKLVPISWPFSSNNENLRYVHVHRLKDLVDDLNKIETLKTNLTSVEKFKEIISSKVNVQDPTEMNILIDYLKLRKLIAFDKVGPEEVVLLGNGSCISEVQKGRYDIRRITEFMEVEVDKLQLQIETAQNNAKEALKQKRRATAKHELRRKKLAEKQLEKRSNMLDTLYVLATRIEETETDAKILLAYEAGKKALTASLKDNNLTEDRVSETMLDIQDLLDTQQEITSAISQPLDNEDLSELDSELEMLLKEDEEAKILNTPKVKEEEEDELLKRLEKLRVGGSHMELDAEDANLSRKSIESPSQ